MLTASRRVKVEDVQGDLCITMLRRHIGRAIYRLVLILILIADQRRYLQFQAPVGWRWLLAVFLYLVIIAFVHTIWLDFCTCLIRVSPRELTVTRQGLGITWTSAYAIPRISHFETELTPFSPEVSFRFRYRGFTRRIQWSLPVDNARSLIAEMKKRAPQLATEPTPA